MATVSVNDPVYSRAVQFLYDEAALLDNGRFEEWLESLTDDVVYRVPVTLTAEGRAANTCSADGHFFYDNLESLAQRVKRLKTGMAWAEDPPSRTCRFISNIRVETMNGDEIRARSNVLVYRSRGESAQVDLLAGERDDTLREVSGHLRLARREVRLAQSALGLPSLSFFL